MENKKIFTKLEARTKLLAGARTICDIVGSTLGPKGRNAVIANLGAEPIITNDGVTIAKCIRLEDEAENIGASIVKQASIESNLVAGDGTTTACVLTRAIIDEANEFIEKGASPIFVSRGINLASKIVADELRKISKPVIDNIEIQRIATISSSDEQIGGLIADAYRQVGRGGIITFEEGTELGTKLVLRSGIRIASGLASPYFATDIARGIADYSDVYILLTNSKITNLGELLPILEQIKNSQKPLLIIASDFSSEVIATLAINKIKGGLPIVCVRATAYGTYRDNQLMDLSVITGAKFIDNSIGGLSTITLEDLGRAKKVEINSKETVIIDGAGSTESIDSRLQEINQQLLDRTLSEDSIERKILQERKRNFASVVAVIEIACPTNIETIEKKLRIEDALSATRVALTDGTVVGGGCALVRTLPALDRFIETLSDDTRLGAISLRNAVSAPLLQIISNAGGDASEIIRTVMASTDIEFGYDASRNKFVNLRSEGIIDPTIVTLTALSTSVSVASTLITTDSIIM